MKPHKWAKEIHAYAEGAVIQYFAGSWIDAKNPRFFDTHEYRIKSGELLWEVAKNAFYAAPELDSSSSTWQAVVDAVITAYEEQNRE